MLGRAGALKGRANWCSIMCAHKWGKTWAFPGRPRMAGRVVLRAPGSPLQVLQSRQAEGLRWLWVMNLAGEGLERPMDWVQIHPWAVAFSDQSVSLRLVWPVPGLGTHCHLTKPGGSWDLYIYVSISWGTWHHLSTDTGHFDCVSHHLIWQEQSYGGEMSPQSEGRW